MADKEEFIRAMAPHALAISAETGIAPELIISQSALETGWGSSVAGNNYFGIKSHGKSGGQTVNTHEYVNGSRVNTSDNFRQYPGVAESMRDYADFLRENSRYREVLEAKTLDEQIKAMGRSGYATDPQYGNKLASISRDVSGVLGRSSQPQPRTNIKIDKMPSIFGNIFNTGKSATMGLVAGLNNRADQVLANPMNKLQIGMSMVGGANRARQAQQRPQAMSLVGNSRPQPAQNERKVLIPGGDSVLKSIMTRDVGNTNKDFARMTGRSESEINKYRENKRNGLI